MVVFIRCNDIVSDPRAMKYIRYYDENNIEYKLIGWNRDNREIECDDSLFFNKKAVYNVGGVHAIMNRVLWILFVIKTLYSLKYKELIVHACDLDGAFPAAVFKAISRKKIFIIFDIFDWFSATLYNQGKIVLSVFKYMERFSINKSDHIIICEKERKEQIPYTIADSKLSVLPNIPMFNSREFLSIDHKFSFDNSNITFSYVGGFSQDRSLNEIISIAERGQINLLIAGYGDSQIEERLCSLKNCKFIKYYGKVEYQEGLQIMYNSDIIYAMYQKVNPNHIYAAPNKFYESMFLGKTIFTTKGTIVGTKVENNTIGYISEETESDILNVIKTIETSDTKSKGSNSAKLWNQSFKDYTNLYMNNVYSKLIGKKN